MTDTTCDPAPAGRAFFAAKLAHEIDPGDLTAVPPHGEPVIKPSGHAQV
ncbi:MAG: hypothetical protein U1D00_22430 [Mycobacterium sp.]|nr:hypothetical protein [Mycobacterium sp.]